MTGVPGGTTVGDTRGICLGAVARRPLPWAEIRRRLMQNPPAFGGMPVPNSPSYLASLSAATLAGSLAFVLHLASAGNGLQNLNNGG